MEWRSRRSRCLRCAMDSGQSVAWSSTRFLCGARICTILRSLLGRAKNVHHVSLHADACAPGIPCGDTVHNVSVVAYALCDDRRRFRGNLAELQTEDVQTFGCPCQEGITRHLGELMVEAGVYAAIRMRIRHHSILLGNQLPQLNDLRLCPTIRRQAGDFSLNEPP